MTTGPNRSCCAIPLDRAAAVGIVLARWVLGGLFLYMGLSKALHPVVFLKLVRQYDMVTSPFLLNFIAATLPWFEVFCGLLLLLGVTVRGAALVSLLMLVPFTALVFKRAWAIHLATGQPFCAIRFDCGCGNGEVLICAKLLENTVLIFFSAILLLARQGHLCLCQRLGPRELAPQEDGVVPASGQG